MHCMEVGAGAESLSHFFLGGEGAAWRGWLQGEAFFWQGSGAFCWLVASSGGLECGLGERRHAWACISCLERCVGGGRLCPAHQTLVFEAHKNMHAQGVERILQGMWVQNRTSPSNVG